MPAEPMVGTEFAGYRLNAVISRTNMSVVYTAEHPRLGHAVALKVLAPDLASNDRFRERFVSESRMAAGIRHPNVIPIYDAGPSDGLLYIAMLYVAGADLREDAIIGRVDAGVLLDDDEVSRYHAIVRVGEGGADITDLGSTNGTYVDGRRLTGRAQLVDGSLIRVGRTELRVVLAGR